jgi:PPE-repeat protein
MARRQPYSLVLIGARKEEARKKYLAFLSGLADRPSKIGTGGARSPILDLSINPFGIELPANVNAVGTANIKSLAALQGFAEFTGRVKLASAAPANSGVTIPAAAATITSLKLGGGFSPARVIRKTYTGSTVPKKSEITGLMYGKRNSESVSAAFGQEASSDTIAEAIQQLEGQLKSTINTRVYFRSEISA